MAETTVGVRPMGDGIEVRFKLHGKTVRPRLPMKGTKANLLHASRLRKQIMDEIARGTFDMLKHFPDYKFAAKVKAEAPVSLRTVRAWYDVWVKLAQRSLEHSSLAVYKRHMVAYWLPELGDKLPAAVTNETVLSILARLAEESETPSGKVKKGLSRKTQNNILIPLRHVFDMIGRSPGAPPNPVDGIENLKVQKPNPDPFTLEEVELSLASLRKHGHEVLADYFEFAAFAGLRVSEQIALRWEQVDLRTSTIIIQRARVMAKEKERTKTTVERVVELNGRAAAVIERQRARTQLANAEVFWSPTTGKRWHDDQSQRTAWRQTLRLCGIRHRPPKELRDSSVTFALMAGADPWYVAQQHGHSLQVMLDSYAKWIPNADRGRNRKAINAAVAPPAAPPAASGTDS